MEFGLDYLAGRQVTSKHDMAYSLLLHKTFSERTIYPPIRDSSLCGLMALVAFNPKNLNISLAYLADAQSRLEKRWTRMHKPL